MLNVINVWLRIMKMYVWKMIDNSFLFYKIMFIYFFNYIFLYFFEKRFCLFGKIVCLGSDVDVSWNKWYSL